MEVLEERGSGKYMQIGGVSFDEPRNDKLTLALQFDCHLLAFGDMRYHWRGGRSRRKDI
jgi:hypothetical protein